MLALAVVTVGLYWPVHTYGFIPTDDSFNIESNPYLSPVTTSNLAYLWTHPFGSLYIPVAYTAYAAICLFAKGPHGYLPGPFHVANLLLHVANTLLVYAVLLRFVSKPWAAGLGALLFALHPVQVGAVAWLTETRGLVSAFFALLALMGYLQYAQTDRKTTSRNFKWYIAGTACFVLALLSKPSAVAIPVIAAALDLWMVRRRPADVLKLAGPWAIMAIVVVAVTSTAQPVEADLRLPLWQRPVVMCDTLAFYTAKVFVPWKIAFDYARSSPSVASGAWGYATATAGALLIAVVVWLGRGRPWVWACATVFAAMVLPVSGLAPFMYQAISTVSDRYLYLAMLGPALALAIVVGQSSQRAIVAAATCLIAVYGIVASVNLPYWHDPIRLLTRTTQVTHRSWFAWANLGSCYMQAGNNDLALQDTEKCLEINPHFKIALSNMCLLLDAKGDIDGAVKAAEVDIQYNPDYGLAYGLLGADEVREGSYATAAATLEEALQHGLASDEAAEAQYWWGRALVGEQQPADAITHFQEALQIAPGNPDYQAALQKAESPPTDGTAEVQRGLALASAGQMDQAIAVWTAAAAKYPKLAEAHGNLGVAYYDRRDYPNAVREFKSALAANPNAPEAEVGLGAALAAEGNKAGAAAAYNKALALQPGFPDALNALQQLGGH